MSDTPETDAEMWLEGNDYSLDDYYVVDVSFARKLERQRNELLEALKAASNYVDALGGDSKGHRQVIAKSERGEA